MLNFFNVGNVFFGGFLIVNFFSKFIIIIIIIIIIIKILKHYILHHIVIGREQYIKMLKFFNIHIFLISKSG
jgi:hypothetical protein